MRYRISLAVNREKAASNKISDDGEKHARTSVCVCINKLTISAQVYTQTDKINNE